MSHEGEKKERQIKLEYPYNGKCDECGADADLKRICEYPQKHVCRNCDNT